jgi:hypothetical protein
MKKCIALTMAILLCLSVTAWAAEWKEGRSPAKPYGGVPEVDLNETMGYILLSPNGKLPASMYCDRLQIFLPREDVTLNEGFATLHTKNAEVAKLDFSDPETVVLRPMTEDELVSVMWGSGVCIEMQLPTSLVFGENYYVTMDEGCFSAADGKVISLPVANKEAWKPVVEGDFGVSGLTYHKALPEDAKKNAKPEMTTEPTVGDSVTFDVIIGGDAVVAVLYSTNESVTFENTEITESGTITGAIVGEDVSWGIMFLNDKDENIGAVSQNK